MLLNHNGYLYYELPDYWCSEENADNLLLYNPDGEGAITLSFFNVLDTSSSLDGQVVTLSKRFIDKII